MLIGLSTYTTRHHIARATLEATCFQTRAILEAMGKDTVGTRAEVAEAVQWDSLPNGHDHHAPKDEGGTEKKAVSQMGIQKLKVDGGMTASDLTMQIQADILGIEVERPEMRE
jgi:glycerol kinase